MGLELLWLLGCVGMDSVLSATVDFDPPASSPGEPAPVPVPPRPYPTVSFDARGAPLGVDGEPGAELFAAGSIHDLAITLSDDAWRSLRDDPREEVRGTVTWRTVEYDAGIRLKGSSSFRTIDEKCSFKIDVHAFEDARRIDGLKRLTLNNQIQDPTMAREHAYYWLAASVGVPGSRHGYARVTVNGEAYGLYGLVETMDERLLDRLFPDDDKGNLYESSGADFTDARNWFDLEEEGGVVPAPDDLDDLIDALEDADGDAYVDVMRERFDMDALLGYLALDLVTGNDDGYVFNHHNYHAYHLAFADRWVLLPWGTDRSFTREVSPYGGGLTPIVGVLATRCWDDEACADALTERIVDVLDVWEGPFRDHVGDTLARVSEACEDDPKREKSCDPDDLAAFVDRRAEYVRDALE